MACCAGDGYNGGRGIRSDGGVSGNGGFGFFLSTEARGESPQSVATQLQRQECLEAAEASWQVRELVMAKV
eukprot:CAMPEP_0174745052 /NCGR_PEP_ID=MMETSP1094-20130205/85924_1 /TAXON_ID=156173 /ORGANISM="Chrysochromulina brevifilum, Strain UTEX LB 985" /LENGTH=70 /DNA_ID=CAMNT_0015949545 /DNA_START=314 /DNA_END=527 /DNA_ORIENTATION=+